MKYFVLGGCGSGKTFFAKQLGERYNCKVTDLDDFFRKRKPDNIVPPQEEAEKIVRQLFNESEDIILEGAYVFPKIFNSFDKIFVLKPGFLISLLSVFKRDIHDKESFLGFKLFRQIFKQYLDTDFSNYRYFRYKVVEKLLENEDCEVIVFNSRREVNKYLDSL
jgi:hypothetical protein